MKMYGKYYCQWLNCLLKNNFNWGYGGEGGGLILYDTTIDWEATVSGCSAHKWTAINNGKGSKWSFDGVYFISMVTDQLQWHEILLPIDYNHHNLNKKPVTFIWEDISGKDVL